MRLAHSAHTSRPWRIHEIAPDFRVEDVWALPTPGGPDDFPRLLAMMTRARLPSSGAAGALAAVRERVGELFGWDEDDDAGPSLRDRLSDDLRDTNPPQFAALPFEPLYAVDDEFAAEAANRTMHGVLHVSWVEDGAGYRGQLAVLVKPNGLLGHAYMLAIRPFRYAIVYPALLRGWERAWARR